MWEKASPDVASRFFEDCSGCGRSDRDAISGVIEETRLLKKSVTLVLVDWGVRNVETEVPFGGSIPEGFRCCRTRRASSGSRPRPWGCWIMTCSVPTPGCKLQRISALAGYTVWCTGHLWGSMSHKAVNGIPVRISEEMLSVCLLLVPQQLESGGLWDYSSPSWSLAIPKTMGHCGLLGSRRHLSWKTTPRFLH